MADELCFNALDRARIQSSFQEYDASYHEKVAKVVYTNLVYTNDIIKSTEQQNWEIKIANYYKQNYHGF